MGLNKSFALSTGLLPEGMGKSDFQNPLGVLQEKITTSPDKLLKVPNHLSERFVYHSSKVVLFLRLVNSCSLRKEYLEDIFFSTVTGFLFYCLLLSIKNCTFL